MPTPTATLFAGLVLALAPAPAEPPPDPLARGYLGIRVEQGSLTIREVEPNTPASKAGLKDGDVIVKVGKLEPKSFDEVVNHICALRPGSVLDVHVRRGEEERALKVTLGARPSDLPPPPAAERPMLPGAP